MIDPISQAQLNAVIDAFECDGGTVPWVTPIATLYAHYQSWMKRKGRTPVDIGKIVLALAREQAGVPCRLPDGSLGMLGLKPKSDFH